MSVLAHGPQTVSDSGDDYSLARLIEPVDQTTFRAEFWERKPLLVQRDDPEYYADLLTLDDVDQLLASSGVTLDNIRVVVEGKETQISELGRAGRNGTTNNLEALYERYRSGSTVVLNSLGERWQPLGRMTQALGAEISARLQINVYLTPGGQARGFNPHYDTHDVFIAQAYGSKLWRLYASPTELPLNNQPHDKSADPGEPVQEIELRAGDLLYLPRGTVHAATSQDTASMHLTIGVHPLLWSTVITDTVLELFSQDVRFRSSLPLGFAADKDLQAKVTETFEGLAEALHQSLSPSAMTEAAVRQAVSINSPALGGHLTDLERLKELGPDTRLRRRPDLTWNLTSDGDRVRLDFHNKTVELPADVLAEVRYVAESIDDGFTASAIPGDLDEPGRMVLVQTLLREGFLTLTLT